jgi:hypothetical protein
MRSLRNRYAFVFVFATLLLRPHLVQAQVANPATVDFDSTDQNAIIPAGSVNAGLPVLTGYQGLIFPTAADPTQSGLAVSTGPVISKALAVAQVAANRYRLTFAQLGVTVPGCTALPCPQFRLLVIPIGPGNKAAASGVSAESDPFTAAVPSPQPAPAAVTNVKVGP